MHAVQQDDRDGDDPGRRSRRRSKRRREPLSTAEKDRLLLRVGVLTRLGEVSPSEFQMYWENAVPPEDT